MSRYNDYNGGGGWTNTGSINIDYEVEDRINTGSGTSGTGRGSSSRTESSSTSQPRESVTAGNTSQSGRSVTIDTGSGISYGTLSYNSLNYKNGTSFKASIVGGITVTSFDNNWNNIPSNYLNSLSSAFNETFNLGSTESAKLFLQSVHANTAGVITMINYIVFATNIVRHAGGFTITSHKNDDFGFDWRFNYGNFCYFDVRFERAYEFNEVSQSASAGFSYDLQNFKSIKKDENDNTISQNSIKLGFTVVNKPLSLDINYADIKDFLWFNVAAYYKLNEASVMLTDKNGVSYEILLYSDVSEEEKNPLAYDCTLNKSRTEYEALHSRAALAYRWIDKEIGYGSSEVDSKATVMNIYSAYLSERNSEFYYYKETNLNKVTHTIKAYLPGLVDYINSKRTGNRGSNEDPLSYDEIVTINVILKYETNAVTEGAYSLTAITDAPAFQAYANTHCYVEYINANYKLHNKFVPQIDGEPELIAIYKLNSGETKFQGNISVFYGNQIMYNEKYQTSEDVNSGITTYVSTPKGNPYAKTALYYSLKKSGDALYVYVNKSDSGDFYLHKFVSISLSDDSGGTYKKATNYTYNITQDTVTLHNIDVSVPQVSKGDSLVFIDESFSGKTRHYTTYTKLKIGNSFAYYGVRAYAKKPAGESVDIKYFDNTIYNLGINNLTYNVDAEIVQLIPRTEQQNIYSFANGEEYVLLNKASTKIDVTGNGAVTGKEILNGQLKLSYEFQIDGTTELPKYSRLYTNSGDVILNTYAYANTGFDTFSIEYSYIITENTSAYNHIVNISPNVPIELGSTVYTYAFTKYNNRNEIEENNIYERVEEYVQIPSGNITLEIFKNVIKASEERTESGNPAPYGEDVYYKYSSERKTYSPYKYDDIKGYSSVPLNLYVKYVYYVKTSEQKNAVEFGSDKPFRYKKNANSTSTYNPCGSLPSRADLDSGVAYYQLIDGEYVKYDGLVRNGSMEYYGFKVRPWKEMKGEVSLTSGKLPLNSLDKQFAGYNEIYVKQNYTPVNQYIKLSSSIKSIYDLKAKGEKLYRRTDYIDYIALDDSETIKTIYDIDVTGNTIYASDADISKIIPLNAIKNALESISTTAYPTESEILRSKEGETNYRYRITQFPVNGEKIKYIVSFSGIYTYVPYSNMEIIRDETNKYTDGEWISKDESICIKVEALTWPSTEYTNKIKSVQSALKDYNTENILFTNLFSRLTADDLATANVGNIKAINSTENNPGFRYFYKTTGGFVAVEDNESVKMISGSSSTAYNRLVGFIQTDCEVHSKSNPSTGNYWPFYYKSLNESNNVYEITYDIHMSINKDYFNSSTNKTYNGRIVGNKTGIYIDTYHSTCYFTGSSAEDYDGNNVIKTKLINVLNSSNYNTYISLINAGDRNDADYIKYSTLFGSVKYDTLSLFKDGVTDYSLSSADTFNRIPNGSTYTEDIFLRTKFFYPSYTFNDGIHVDANGAYFTNVMGFDSELGKTSKKIYLNNHIINVDKYNYKKSEYGLVSVDLDTFQREKQSVYDYSKYYIQYNNASGNPVLEKLNPNSEPPTYYINDSTYTLYTKVLQEAIIEYDGLDDTQALDDDNNPLIIKMNNSFYGLIFNTKLEDTIDSEFITFDSGYEYLNGTPIINPTWKTSVWEFDSGDNVAGANSGEGGEGNEGGGITTTIQTDKLESILRCANDELYYNNYKESEITACHLYNMKINHKDYLYEIVPLSLFTFRNYNSDKSILQYKDIITQSVVAKQPFAIDNGETVHFTGTYSWVAPEYSTVIGDDGFKKITIARDGYWKKDYITEKNAFKVSSYNYYEKDKISAINVTYQYIPNSYVVTAEISHPAIAYECLLGEVREEIKYSYLLNGFEYDYYNSNAISYDNGTYWGQIQLLDINDSYVNTKVKLYKKNTIVNSTYVEKIQVQPAYVSYEYYTYKEATPLSNEKIPVLYKTELIPAKKKKVQYWDKSTNSYAIKSVLASYAYFSYSYTYETVPFQVASYIYSDGLNISNFPVLGGYISNIGESISSEMKVQSNAVKQLTYDLTQLVSYNIVQERNIANEEIVTFSTYQTVIDNTLKEFDKNTSNSLSNMSSGLNEKITTLTNKEEAAINKLEEGVVAEIIEQHNIIKDSLNDVKNTINDRLESFEEVYHADTIGEAAKEEKESKWESITYTPIIEKRSGLISGYSYSKQSGSQTITIGGDSIGEILQTTLGCVSTYTVTKYNDNGSYTVTTYEGFNGLANILANLSINKKLPDYKEFMVDLVPKMFASVDFEGDYNIVYDVNGNVKSKEKRNPTDIAKKCIMRADILWEELKKKNIVS